MSANRPHAILPSAHNGQRAHASRAFNQQLRVQGFKPYTFHLYLHVRVLYYYCHTSSSTSQPFHNKPDFKTVQHPTLRPGLPTPPRPTPLVPHMLRRPLFACLRQRRRVLVPVRYGTIARRIPYKQTFSSRIFSTITFARYDSLSHCYFFAVIPLHIIIPCSGGNIRYRTGRVPF